MRIAMWSGPRNLSTAMMYSFAARGDCAVVDEPFYAAYLRQTGLTHPMQDEILAAQPNDPAHVIKTLTGPPPGAQPHFYLKLMTHHMTEATPRDWIAGMTNVFLIRHPARVIASYAAKRENPSLSDLGFAEQAALFDACLAHGQAPIVVDSHDIRADPEATLKKLCVALKLDWTPSMLKWPVGGHPADGVWASHWYGAVHTSTGFAGAEEDLPQLNATYAELCAQALPWYEKLAASPFNIAHQNGAATSQV